MLHIINPGYPESHPDSIVEISLVFKAKKGGTNGELLVPGGQ
jgi:hypothetical protein